MKKLKQKLLVEQVDNKIKMFMDKESLDKPTYGWIYSVRTALNMSLTQLGCKLNMSRQGARALEVRESKGVVSIESLNEVANVLNMKLVYGFIPKDGSLDKMIENRAYEIAKEIVKRTNTTMKLENQQISKEQLEKEIENVATRIKNEMPQGIWD